MKGSRITKTQDKAPGKHKTTSNSVDKTFSCSGYKKTIEAVKTNGPKVVSKRNASLPKDISLPAKKEEVIAKNPKPQPQLSVLEMETARIFINLLTPLISHKNTLLNALSIDDTNKSNRDNLAHQGLIYKKTHPIFQSKVYGRVVKQFSQFLPKRIQLIQIHKTVIPPKTIANDIKVDQMNKLKTVNCLGHLCLKKVRDNVLFIRVHKAFEDEIMGLLHNYNSLYSMYLENQRQRDMEAWNCTSVIHKTNNSNSTIQGQGTNIKTIMSETNSRNALKANMKKMYDIGLTPFPSKKHKSKRFDYEFVTASRAANLIRRIEYSNYIKYCQPKSKDDFILLLNTKAVILQRWWRRMLTNNTFYYKIITIQRMYRGHITKSAFYSASKLIRPYIPFFAKLIFAFNKARMDHLFNKLLCNAAYLYQYAIIYEKQAVIISGFKSYKRRHRNEFYELNQMKALLTYPYLKKHFSNIRLYKSLLGRVAYLQKNIKMLLIKRRGIINLPNSPHYISKGKVINFKYKTATATPSQACLRILDAIQKYAYKTIFALLSQANQKKIVTSSIIVLIPQKDILIKIISKRHLKNCLYWLKRQYHKAKLSRYLSMKLINAAIKNIVFIPVTAILFMYSNEKALSRRSNKNRIQNDLQIASAIMKSNHNNNINDNVQVASSNQENANKKLIALIKKIPHLKLKRVFDIYYQTIGERLIKQEQEASTRKQQQHKDKNNKNTSLTHSSIFTTKNKYAIYCSLKKIMLPLIQKEKHAFYIYFTKFVINSQKREITLLKDSNVNFSFNGCNQESIVTSSQSQSQSQTPTPTPTPTPALRLNDKKINCFIIINTIYHAILRRLFSGIKIKAQQSQLKEPIRIKSKLIELCLRNLVKTSNACKKSTLVKYFLKYHSIVYLIQLNDLYLLSTSTPSSLTNKLALNDSSHELPSNILRSSIHSIKKALGQKLTVLLESLGDRSLKLLGVYHSKWKKQMNLMKLNSGIRMIQRNWRLKLLPKQKLSLILLRLLSSQ